ncbi:ABC transporter permease [Streptomyces sp. NPDC051219]|uniref:ABC transporter permease n=1 Tax=Streptomyces sp. NPDC051219 TaxID=3155283 RepID=UPI003438FA88
MSTVRTEVTAGGRLSALARAELTLLGRSRVTLFSALVLPAAMTFAISSSVEEMDLEDTGLTVGTVLLPGAIGFAMLFAVYGGLVGVFVARREELVLKRLRTGEVHDHEIMVGASLPLVLIGLAQCVVLAVGCSVVLDVAAPRAPHLILAGLASGTVMLVALAAATAAFTKTAEAAQLTTMPLLVVSMACSGMVVPLELVPEQIASVCELLPLTAVVELVRSGWTGGDGTYETLGSFLTAVAWTVIAVFAVRRWFRWEPRR